MKYEELEKRVFAWKPITDKYLDLELNNAIVCVVNFTGLAISEVVNRLFSRTRTRENATIKAYVIAFLASRYISRNSIAFILRLNRRTVHHYLENWVLNPFNKGLKRFVEHLTI